MTSRLKYINPLQAGIVCAVLYFLLGIILMLLAMAFAGMMMAAMSSLMPLGRPNPGRSPLGFIFLPFLYAIFGFIGGAIMAWLYNLAAAWTGGIEIRLDSTTTPLEVTA